MTIEETQRLLDGYLGALFGGDDFGRFMAANITLRFMDTGDAVTGREEVVGAIVTAHTVQFEATFEVVSTVVGAGSAAVEILFEATHTAEFAGIPATGLGVRVPYSAFYTTETGVITEIRIYGLALGIMAQLSAGREPATTPAE
jgi:predicted ester cyclase